jgi:hypothetical protein
VKLRHEAIVKLRHEAIVKLRHEAIVKLRHEAIVKLRHEAIVKLRYEAIVKLRRVYSMNQPSKGKLCTHTFRELEVLYNNDVSCAPNRA